MECAICGHTSKELFTGKILGKYTCLYYHCENCGFINTEKPYWMDEAYSSAISNFDIGLVDRNLLYSKEVERIILDNFCAQSRFLDFAGGYGLFVRMMRDRGFDFYRQDKYCQNLFAVNFDVSEEGVVKNGFELLTAFEVFEHLESPIEELQCMTKYADNILFSTELIPNGRITSFKDWWYFVPETGQHISFYTLKSLQVLADRLGLFLYSNEANFHMFTNKKMKKNPFYVAPYSLRYRILPFLCRMVDHLYMKRKGIHLESKIQLDFIAMKKLGIQK